MTKRSFQVSAFTPTATADAAGLVNGTYMALAPLNITAMLSVIEIYEGGQASASSINIMHFARDIVLGATIQPLTAPNGDGPLNSFGATVANITSYVAATTSPQRSTAISAPRLNLSFNSFGGIVRWVAAPGEEWMCIGTGLSVSESSLSAFTGGSAGALGAHIIYEPVQ